MESRSESPTSHRGKEEKSFREEVHSHPGKKLWRGGFGVLIFKINGVCCEDGVGWICSTAQPHDGYILKQASLDVSDVSTHDIWLLPLFKGEQKGKEGEIWGGGN